MLEATNLEASIPTLKYEKSVDLTFNFVESVCATKLKEKRKKIDTKINLFKGFRDMLFT